MAAASATIDRVCCSRWHGREWCRARCGCTLGVGVSVAREVLEGHFRLFRVAAFEVQLSFELSSGAVEGISGASWKARKEQSAGPSAAAWQSILWRDDSRDGGSPPLPPCLGRAGSAMQWLLWPCRHTVLRRSCRVLGLRWKRACLMLLLSCRGCRRPPGALLPTAALRLWAVGTTAPLSLAPQPRKSRAA